MSDSRDEPRSSGRPSSTAEATDSTSENDPVKNARIICYLFGSLLVLSGMGFLIWTEDTMDHMGAVVPAGFAMSNMRAVFGGLELALGLLVVRLAANDRDLSASAFLVFTIFGGLILGRISEIAVNGIPDESFFLTMVLLEATGMVGGIQAIQAIRRAGRSQS